MKKRNLALANLHQLMQTNKKNIGLVKQRLNEVSFVVILHQKQTSHGFNEPKIF
jgi:hypothetical protein